jgi:CubicO group peptidase (beta-lactamase class C family)
MRLRRGIGALLLLCSVAATPPSSTVPIAKIDTVMNAAVAAHRPNGATLAIVRNGSVVYEHAYGMRDVAKRLPATTATQYEIGSLTKQMTAAAVMQLVDEGKVSLDAPLKTYLPKAPHAGEVTIRQLLSLSSGLPEYLTGSNLLNEVDVPITQQALVARVADEPLNFPPGTRWQHSNTNYVLLGLTIEAASGETYERYLSDGILVWVPGAQFATIDDEPQLEQMAQGYAGGKPSPPLDGSWLWAAGYFVGSVDDMLAWDAALSGGRVVSPSSYTAMTTVQTPKGGAVTACFPFFIDTFHGRARVWHDGSTLGFSTADQYYPQSRLRVLVFTNDGSGVADTLADRIAAYLL